MAFNEKFNKHLEGTQKEKPFNYDIIFGKNSELRKQNTLLQVKFKALSMEEKDVNLWWDVVHDIGQKNIGKVCKKYERNERLYRYKISKMENVIPLFEYEPLFCLQNQKLQMRKKTEGIQMGQDHHVQEQQRSQEISEEERIAPRGRLLNRL